MEPLEGRYQGYTRISQTDDEISEKHEMLLKEVPGESISPLLRMSSRRMTSIFVLTAAMWFTCAMIVPKQFPSEVYSSATTQLYLPIVHDDIVKKAFDDVYANTSARLSDLMRHQGKHLVDKMTLGTCKLMTCDPARGPTDCLLERCFCKYGYETVDGFKCVPLGSSKASHTLLGTETRGTCVFKDCDPWRGNVSCKNFGWFRTKCVCKKGFKTIDGDRCHSIETIENIKGEEEMTLLMMRAGIVEPDVLTCPHAQEEMASNAIAMIAGNRQYTEGACRLSIQAYHGSPFPLVTRNRLLQPPIKNGYTSNCNISKEKELYAVITNQQHRTGIIRLMSRQFVYAIAAVDVAEGARRLGNMLHTLTDTWSASHVVRTNGSSCSRRNIMMFTSMDVVNWVVHTAADKREDDGLFECAVSFTRDAIRLWSAIRMDVEIMNTSAANAAIDMLVAEVLCPSLPMAAEDLDRPAGGASADWSSEWIVHKSVFPVGTSTENDGIRIIKQWERDAARDKNEAPASQKARYGRGLFVSSRIDDACADAAVAHVSEDFVQDAMDGNSPDYIMPAPPILRSHYTDALANTTSKDLAEILIEDGADPNTALSKTISKQEASMLVTRGADATVALENTSSTENADILIEDGAGANTALMQTISKHAAGILVEEGLDATAALTNTTSMENADILIEDGADAGAALAKAKSGHVRSILLTHALANTTNTEMAAILIEKGADANIALSKTISKLIARMLIRKGVDATAALANTTSTENADILIDNGADASTALMKTISKHAVNILVEKGVNATAALANTTSKENAELLIGNGADANAALMTTISKQAAKMLIETGADANTALSRATLRQNAVALIEGGADADVALFIAAERAQPRTIKLLLDCGASSTSRDELSRTPMAIAMINHNEGAMHILQARETTLALYIHAVRDKRSWLVVAIGLLAAFVSVKLKRCTTIRSHETDAYVAGSLTDDDKTFIEGSLHIGAKAIEQHPLWITSFRFFETGTLLTTMWTIGMYVILPSFWLPIIYMSFLIPRLIIQEGVCGIFSQSLSFIRYPLRWLLSDLASLISVGISLIRLVALAIFAVYMRDSAIKNQKILQFLDADEWDENAPFQIFSMHFHGVNMYRFFLCYWVFSSIVSIAYIMMACCWLFYGKPREINGTKIEDIAAQIRKATLERDEFGEPRFHLSDVGDPGLAKAQPMKSWGLNGVWSVWFTFIAAQFLDFNTLLTLLVAQHWIFATIMVFVVVDSFLTQCLYLHDQRGGYFFLVYFSLTNEAKKSIEKGIYTKDFLALLQTGQGFEAFFSFLITAYSLPYAVRTPLQIITQFASLLVNLKGMSGFVEKHVDYCAPLV